VLGFLASDTILVMFQIAMGARKPANAPCGPRGFIDLGRSSSRDSPLTL
jgi:hypothetical protein